VAAAFDLSSALNALELRAPDGPAVFNAADALAALAGTGVAGSVAACHNRSSVKGDFKLSKKTDAFCALANIRASDSLLPLSFGQPKFLQLPIDELAELFVLDQPVHDLIGAAVFEVALHYLPCRLLIEHCAAATAELVCSRIL